MKAVILDGSFYSANSFFAADYPLIAFPIANEPLIIHNLNILLKNKITDVAIILDGHLSRRKSAIEKINKHKLNGINLSWYEETSPKGSAGSLKDLKEFIGSSPFLVIPNNKYIGELDLSKLFTFHLTRKAEITVAVEHTKTEKNQLENIEVDENGVVKKFHILHHSKDNRRTLRPSGLYIFNPGVLDYVFELGYMDINEQLVSRLSGEKILTYSYGINGHTREVNNFVDYFQLNKEILLNGLNNGKKSNQVKTEIMDRVWVGKNAKISPKAYILGPVIIGDDCVIEDYSQIIGPTTIGNGSHIENDVLVRETIIWEDVHLMGKSCVEYSVIEEGCTIFHDESIKNDIVIQNKRCKKYSNLMFLDKPNINDVKVSTNNKVKTLTSVFSKRRKHKGYLFFKRLLDIVVSLLCLLLFSPLLLFVALAIKIDSTGPVFFNQKRCGKEGKEFKMYKFRTMVQGAEKAQQHLLNYKDIDGPMFKMKNDPRVTKLGKFLRESSLDELPQFLNVLKGEMSLVGPRPLIMEEMKFAPGWRNARLTVKPGITGMWQINGRSESFFHDWIEHDINYIRNQSFKLDLRILLHTIGVVFKGVGAE